MCLPLQKAGNEQLWISLAVETDCWTNSQFVSDFRQHGTHVTSLSPGIDSVLWCFPVVILLSSVISPGPFSGTRVTSGIWENWASPYQNKYNKMHNWLDVQSQTYLIRITYLHAMTCRNIMDRYEFFFHDVSNGDTRITQIPQLVYLFNNEQLYLQADFRKI